jgi:peptidoglycan hydrolase CwlO-like protein
VKRLVALGLIAKIKIRCKNTNMNLQLDLTTIIISAIGAVIWLVRLEGKVSHINEKSNETQKDVDSLRVKHDALDSKIVDKLAEISERLARIEGAFHHKGDE